MCAYKRKSWIEKRNTGKEPVIERIDGDFADIRSGETMLIATPAVVDDYIRQISRGRQTTLQQMRKDLAAAFHADKTCPVTAGIFLRIVAEAAWEEYQQGKALRSITPFWRIMDEKSPTAKKLSFGTDWLMAQRKKEGLSAGR